MERLSSRIGKNMGNDKSKRESKAMFLAYKEEIEEALIEGWSVKTIWKTLHSEGRYPSTYQNFAKYVRMFINKSEKIYCKSESNSISENNKNSIKKSKSPTLSGFEFKPIFNTKELYGEEE